MSLMAVQASTAFKAYNVNFKEQPVPAAIEECEDCEEEVVEEKSSNGRVIAEVALAALGVAGIAYGIAKNKNAKKAAEALELAEKRLAKKTEVIEELGKPWYKRIFKSNKSIIEKAEEAAK